MKTLLKTTLVLSLLSCSQLVAQFAGVAESAEESLLIAFKLNPEGRLQGRCLSKDEAAKIEASTLGDAIPARNVSSDSRIVQLSKNQEVVVRVAPLRLRAGGGGASTMSEPQPGDYHDAGFSSAEDQYREAHREWEERVAREKEEAERAEASRQAFEASERERKERYMSQLREGCSAAELADEGFMQRRKERLEREFEESREGFKSIHQQYHGGW